MILNIYIGDKSMVKKFKVKIKLSTDNMKTSDDVIDALEHVIADIRGVDFKHVWVDAGGIYDVNGKDVGRWDVS